MNASLRLFAKLSAGRARGGVAACVALGALLGGCAGNPFAEAPIDPASPVAEDVSRMVKASRQDPTFASIPPVPKEERKLADWGKAADQLEIAGAKLDRETAPNTWTLTGTEGFAARARSQAGPDLDTSTSTTTASEAFAKELRERATPPPSPR
ncbi:hypothetical protein [Phenylobacterium sp.]|jgi:hypothetical protein|uniref:hypothetical protein n=1 Tax=Phenylobacterium sp. TaxID=1871053 RepID=UPI0035B3561A